MLQGDKSAGSGSRAKSVVAGSISLPGEFALEMQPETSGAAAAGTAVDKAMLAGATFALPERIRLLAMIGGGETDQASDRNIMQRW